MHTRTCQAGFQGFQEIHVEQSQVTVLLLVYWQTQNQHKYALNNQGGESVGGILFST